MKNKLTLAATMIALLFAATTYAQQAKKEVTPSSIVTYAINDLLVYPNPVTSNTHIVLNTLPLTNVYVDVIDMNGNVVRSYTYVDGIYNLDVDLNTIPGGLYSIRVYGKDVGFHNLAILKQ